MIETQKADDKTPKHILFEMDYCKIDGETQVVELPEKSEFTYDFPSCQKILNLPKRVLLTSDSCTLIEIVGGNVQEQHLSLHIACPAKCFKVLYTYHPDRVDIHYLILDASNYLHIVERCPKLKEISIFENVEQVKICSSDETGEPECRIRRRCWETLQPGCFQTKSTLVRDPPKVDAVSPPLNNALESFLERLKFLKIILMKKRLLRANIINSLDFEMDELSHVKVEYCQFFVLHGRLVFAAKIKNVSSIGIKDVTLVALTSSNLNLSQLTPTAELAEGETTIRTATFEVPPQEFYLSIEYFVNDLKHCLPLATSHAKTVINLHQRLKSIGIGDCVQIFPSVSSKLAKLSWKPNFSSSVSRSLKRSLKFLPLIEDSINRIALSTCDHPDLRGSILIEFFQKNQALLFFRDAVQLRILTFLLGPLPVFIRTSQQRELESEKCTISTDVALIREVQVTSRKPIPIPAYFQVLQDLIHRMSIFKR
ncbi:uncharacterized protein LOC132202193 isoform X2 [Neocloeon triangulifer]|uniref:uncharacterized protein LOC132202193 isoform X2 n=1 Tax=Neocloeon triangulifer TaxID=2078957 RepID=UPI00286EFA68|nr:uncharacterized protein LOC132202193 isoform X2 [Neocloeon triangulifer]